MGLPQARVTLNLNTGVHKKVSFFKPLKRIWKQDVYKHSGFQARKSDEDYVALNSGRDMLSLEEAGEKLITCD